MKKANSTKPLAAKKTSRLLPKYNSKHDYSTPRETANTGSNTQDRMSTTPTNTPEKSLSEMQQHSTMLAAITKSVQLNSEELKEYKTKIKHLGKQIESITKDADDIKGHSLNQERYKRRWCLRIKGKKEKINENIRAKVVELLGRIAPDLKMKMYEAVDVFHTVG